MKRFLAGIVILFLTVYSAWGQVPALLNYQGILKDASGNSVPDGNYQITFNLYDVATGGTALWTEVHAAVATSQGIFNVVLGNTAPLNLPFDKQYHLGITIDADPEMTPRTQLTSAPYSLNTRTAGESFALLAYDLPTNTNGGSAIAGSWITRALNTEVYDPNGIVSLSSNQFTLPPGDYILESAQTFWSQAGIQQDFRGRIRNITDGITVSLGLNVRAHIAFGESTSMNAPTPPSFISITATKTFELQYFAQNSLSDLGLGGTFMNEGEVERYAYVYIKKLK